MKGKYGYLILLIGIVFIYSGCGLEKTNQHQETVGESPSRIEEEMEVEQDIKQEVELIETLEPVFASQPIPELVQEKMQGASWQDENPVSLEDLSYVQVAYWGFDGKVHQGEIIVHRELAMEVQEIFQELYEAEFPIDKMNLIDEYDADDERSMADNNTSAFCSRAITGKQNQYSKHSYGVAIDINPVQNPYQRGDLVLPPVGEVYLNRSIQTKGMIQEGDPCHTAFVSRGWTWGGSWIEPKDYQHFEK